MKQLIALIGFAFCSGALAGGYQGDYAPGSTVYCDFGTVQPSTGASFTLAGTPAVAAYKDAGTTETTTGVSLATNFDSRTGKNKVTITTASDSTFFSPGAHIDITLTAGTVDGVSVAGQPVCSFSLRKTNLGQSARGTLTGTPTATTADLGTNAPGATSDLVGMTLVVPAKHFARSITAYDTGTGVATFATTSITLSAGDYWELWPTSSTALGTDAINAAALAPDAGAELATAVRDIVAEDQGNISLGCIHAVNLAYAAGDLVTSGGTATWSDPSGTEVRIVSTITSNGNRTVVITCPTY